MAEKQGIPLSSIEGFPESAANRLAELWITTAEELVGAAVREDGPLGLAEFLGVSEDEVTELVERALAALPPDVSFAPDDIASFGLGALDEPEGDDPDAEPVSFAPLPGQVDLRGRMPPVRNQRNRGTCVAHACVAVREFLLGEESESGDLSEQFLYWDCKQKDGYPGEGTWIRVGMDCLKQDGVCVEQVWEYNPDPIPGNESQGPPPAGAADKAASYRISDSQKLAPRWVNALRQTLADGKPVAFAVPVFTYWFTEPVRSTGDVRMPLSTDINKGGHAMCMVGYEDDSEVPGGGFFLVRNSWGATKWGRNNVVESGYARIPYEYIRKHGKSAYTARISEPSEPGRYTNQHIITAFHNAAVKLGLGNWDLMERAGIDLTDLVQDRNAPYRGTGIDQLPNLTEEQKRLIKAELTALVGPTEA